jgi:hypothetical protein
MVWIDRIGDFVSLNSDQVSYVSRRFAKISR